jgi:H+/Cl- antiporter ClcA
MMGQALSPAIPNGFKRWLVASVSVLLVSLALFGVVVVAAFVYFADKTDPLWVTVLGVLAVFGVGIGFAGFFVLMAIAGWQSHREAKRVQVIPPPHDRGARS